MARSQKYQIAFEKWRSPYNLDDENPPKLFDSSELNEFNEEEFDESLLKAERSMAILTPLGILPINEYTSPDKIFNFWVMHTNFNISNKILKIVEEIPGVEIFHVMTRYRAKIGIGKLFVPAGTVMANIEKKLLRYLKYGQTDIGTITNTV